jgi:hypothetical protein
MPKVPRDVAERARDLRHPRRTRAGLRNKSWKQISDELRAEGKGHWQGEDLADAVNHLPLESHPDAPNPEEYSKLEQGWRDGFAEEFPGEKWPGLEEARRRMREKAGFTK